MSSPPSTPRPVQCDKQSFVKKVNNCEEEDDDQGVIETFILL